MSAFRNVGQSCSAPTRMIVPRNRLAQVEALAAATANAIIVGDPQSEETILGPIANQAQFNRVQAMIEVRSEARRVGKECVSTCSSRWSTNTEKKNTLISQKHDMKHNRKKHTYK